MLCPITNDSSTQVYPLAHSEWSFDAKEGFTVQEITPEADGMYTCLASLLAVERQLEFYMDVQRNDSYIYCLLIHYHLF